MFVTRDGERLYLTNWNYNAFLIMGELARIVRQHGGSVKPAKTAVISNRSIIEAARVYNDRIERYMAANRLFGSKPDRDRAINKYRDKLDELQAIPNDPVETFGQTWITFKLDGTVYHYSFNDNPFFDFNFYKTPLVDNKRYANKVYIQPDKKAWMKDEMWSCTCTAEGRRQAANGIFEMLLKAPNSGVFRRRQRVRNYGGSGYHYEYKPAELTKIDF